MLQRPDPFRIPEMSQPKGMFSNAHKPETRRIQLESRMTTIDQEIRHHTSTWNDMYYKKPPYHPSLLKSTYAFTMKKIDQLNKERRRLEEEWRKYV